MDTKNIVYYPVLDTKRAKGQTIQNDISSWLYQNMTSDIDQANAVLVGWWDGFMLDTLKTYFDQDKLFVGVNCGTLWFLLNDITRENLPKSREDIDIVSIHPIQVEVIKKSWERQLLYAMSDIVIGGNILDYFSFDIQGTSFEKQIMGTGMILSTALGSSGYRLGNGGPIFPMQSNLRWIMGIAAKPFNYHLLKPESIRIIPQGRTPIMAGIDGYGGRVDDIQEIILSPSPKTISLGFLKTNDFDSKRIALSNQKLSWI